MTSQLACDLLRKLAGVSEKDHFGSDAFSANKRMFATVWHENKSVNLRLSPDQQRHFLSQDGEAFEVIDNFWGRQGWTRLHLEFIQKDQFIEAMQAAWEYSPIKASGTPKKKSAKKTTNNKITRKAKKKAKR